MSQRRRNAVAADSGGRGGMIIAAVTVGAIMLILGLLIFQDVLMPGQGHALEDLGNFHLEDEFEPHAPYNSSPPTSGPHVPWLAPPQIYDIQVPDEIQVHNLEDGFVIIQYDCPGGCPDLVTQLAGIADEYLADPEGQILMGPYSGITDPITGQPRRIALTAWTRLDAFDEFDEERIQSFIDAYRGLDHHV